MVSKQDRGRCTSEDTDFAGMLQKVLESNIGRCASEDIGTIWVVTNAIKVKHRTTRDAGLQGGGLISEPDIESEQRY